MAKPTAILTVNRGLFLDRPPIGVPPGGWVDCLNVQPKLGSVSNLDLGWSRFEDWALLGPVRLIDRMKLSDGTEELLFADPTDIYRYNPATNEVDFLTPIYATGTASVAAGATPTVTGVGTLWAANVKAGDYIHFGLATQNDPTAAWHRITTVTNDTSMVIVGPVAGAPLAAGVYTIRKTFTGDIITHWDAVTFPHASPDDDDVWFATNGIDPVVKWHSGDARVAPANFGQVLIVQHLAVYANMLILGGITQAGEDLPTSIINSDVGTPENTTSGLSEQFIVHSGVEPIIDMQPLGDNLVVYTPRSGILVQFVGDPLIFTFRRAFTGVGPVSASVVADFGDHHEFIGADTQYHFDGANVQEINNHVWRHILSLRDATRGPLGIAHFDEENGSLIWGIPLTTDAGDTGEDRPLSVAWPQHYLEDVGPQLPTPFSKRSFPFTAAGYYEQQSGVTWDTVEGDWDSGEYQWNEQFFFAAFPINLVGDALGRVYTLNAAQDADGVALPSFVRFGRIALGDGRMRALLSRVYPFAKAPSGGSHNLNVTVRLYEHASGQQDEEETFLFDLGLGEEGHFVSPFRRARFAELEYGTPGPGEDWGLDGYDTDVKPGGRR